MTDGAVDLPEIAATERGPGVVWTQEAGDELNANLVRFPEGGGIGEHANDEVDVLFLGVAGEGAILVDGEETPLLPGRLILVPRGARRATRGASEDFAYLTVHRRRGPVRMGHRRST